MEIGRNYRTRPTTIPTYSFRFVHIHTSEYKRTPVASICDQIFKSNFQTWKQNSEKGSDANSSAGGCSSSYCRRCQEKRIFVILGGGKYVYVCRLVAAE